MCSSDLFPSHDTEVYYDGQYVDVFLKDDGFASADDAINEAIDAADPDYIEDFGTPKAAKYSQYQLPGDKSDYKEVLVTLPTKLSKESGKAATTETVYKSTHFDEPNILVHLRINIRVDADGNKVLFLEEVQSDWGQKGKKEGFKSNERDSRVKELVNKRDDGTITEKERQELGNLISESYKAETPTAPFVTDTNAWAKLGLS